MKLEIRGETLHIEGYVNAVERLSRPLIDVQRRAFVEKVQEGTFAKALAKGGNVELLVDHKRKVGDLESRSLKLREDNIGLFAQAEITDKDVISRARAGEIRGWSFGFSVNEDKWESDGEREVRTLTDINLNEVSLIIAMNPAYKATSIEVRGDEIVEQRECIDNDIEVVDHDPQEETRADDIDYSEFEKRINDLTQ